METWQCQRPEIGTWLAHKGEGPWDRAHFHFSFRIGFPRNLDVMIFAAFDRLDDSSALVSFTGEIR